MECPPDQIKYLYRDEPVLPKQAVIFSARKAVFVSAMTRSSGSLSSLG
jgi:hypothetical protein